MHRFFLLDRPLQAGRSVDLAPIAHQLRNVLRLAPGTHIVLLDGCGAAYCTEIISLERHVATGDVLDKRLITSEPTVQVILYQGSLKADKFEWVLQKGTELGVSCFVPVISARSIVRPAAALVKKYERWRLIVKEAAEQSGRGRLPRLQMPLDWYEAVYYAQGLRYMLWEESVREAGVQGLGQAVETAFAQQNAPNSVSLLIGPEGGIAAEEAHSAVAGGWQPVSLGPRILRAETAALASATIVMERLAQFKG